MSDIYDVADIIQHIVEPMQINNPPQIEFRSLNPPPPPPPSIAEPVALAIQLPEKPLLKVPRKGDSIPYHDMGLSSQLRTSISRSGIEFSNGK